MKYDLDKDNTIHQVFDKVVNANPDDFSFLIENAKFIFTFRNKPTYDEDGYEVAAYARRVANRERDIYGTDFEICVYAPLWEELSDKKRERLIYHELLHCRIDEDEDAPGIPAYDSEDRVSIYIEPHDLVVKTFQKEIETFGLEGHDLKVAKFMTNAYKAWKENQKK